MAYLTLDERASLASLALHKEQDALAERLIEPVFQGYDLAPAARSAMLARYVMACSDAGRLVPAVNLLRSTQGLAALSPVESGNQFYGFTVRAIVNGRVGMLEVLLEQLRQSADEARIAQLLPVAVNNRQYACARELLRLGVDPFPHGQSCAGFVVRNYADIVNTPAGAARAFLHSEAQEYPCHDIAMMLDLLATGAAPEPAGAAAEKWIRDHAIQRYVLDAIYAGEAAFRRESLQHMRNTAPASLAEAVSQREYLVSPFADKKSRSESFLHQAARLRLLPVLIEERVMPLPPLDAWLSRNSAGERVIDLVVASASQGALFFSPIWAGETALLLQLLGHAGDSGLPQDLREQAVHQARLRTLQQKKLPAQMRLRK